MDAQIQCPNCGGYKTFIREGCLYRLLAGAAVWGFIIGGLALAGGIFGGKGTGNAIGVGVVILIIAIVLYAASHAILNKNLCGCHLCGYERDQNKLSPVTRIQVRHDLIEKGNLRLEEEDAQRRAEEARRQEQERQRRQQEEAWWYQQNNK
jgi:hypothetical protein